MNCYYSKCKKELDMGDVYDNGATVCFCSVDCLWNFIGEKV